MAELLHTAILGLAPPRIGKVREVYDLGEALLMVATDRISAFDVVMANGIPDKGAMLTQMSAFWFREFADACPHHVISTDPVDVQSYLKAPQPELNGRSMIVRKATTVPVECVARGYITGSLYKEYVREGRHVHGLDLPDGLRDGDRLPAPIFTPATKAETGHDENISLATMRDQLGGQATEWLEAKTLGLYARAAAHCESRGIILADTKFEFGETPDGLIWIDEAITPDSSRFWDAAGYAPGTSQPSYDKQYVRDYLESCGWDKNPPGPALPEDVRTKTREKYLTAYRLLVGQEFNG
ncbi:MAG: phosphoribosylaminoimidazolesuccinocarboxamide synthase [Fimbriimonadaceae bacterium]|nr:phosphoribosylaminoimidazolesuccinocarboxamide synthase [Fimbriimonadaceae bacterium]